MARMDLAELLSRLVESGVTALVKADVARFAEGGDYWTFVISGGALSPDEVIRVDADDLNACVRTALERLREVGDRWQWTAGFAT